MYSIKKMVQPDNFDEAWELLQKSPRNVILGGGLFLKLGEKSINKAVDLTHLGLDFIEKVDDSIRIGSMVSFGRLEEHKLLNDETGGIIRKSLETIVSKQIRNMATLGGSIITRFGFSDFLPGLLLLNPTLYFYKYGKITLEEYFALEKPLTKDILMEISIPLKKGIGVYCTQKKTYGDFPMLNMALFYTEGQYKIAVGARPGRAMIAEKTSKYLSAHELGPSILQESQKILLDEIPLSTNGKASKRYRELLAKGHLEKCLKEIKNENRYSC